MELLYNAMLANMQMPQQQPQTAPKTDLTPKDGFQKLMEQKADAKADVKPQKTDASEKPEAGQKPEEGQETQSAQDSQETKEVQDGMPKSEKELEEQMSLAAMAMLYNPVVPVEDVASPEAQPEAVMEELAPVMSEAVPVETADPLQELAVVQENPENVEIQAPVQAETEAEVLPETEIPVEDMGGEVPVTDANAEAPEVEVKVEIGQDRENVENTEDNAEDTPELQEADVETPVFKDVKAVPVKVGEAPKAEEAPKPLEQQIMPKLSEAIANGETKVEIQLTPENLGKVTVEMTWSKDGNLVVELHAENRETQNLLSKNTSGLEALLSRESQQEVRVEVPRQEENQRQNLFEQQNQNKQNHHQQQQQKTRPDDTENFLQQLRLGLIPMEESL